MSDTADVEQHRLWIVGNCCVCVVILKESEHHHSIWSPMDGAQPSPKTSRDHVVKDNLGEKEGWLLVGVVAQWQSTDNLTMRPWVQFAATPLIFLSLLHFKGLQTVTARIIFP